MKEQNTAVKPLGIPYGMMNFVAIREDNYYYVDKTRFIEKIENSNRYFFFIRPRRFGKSLTMSMLRHYYDINKADKFERLYGDMVLSFMYKYLDNRCKIPDTMLDDNIRVDYNKLRMLIRKDKEFANDASAIQTLVSQGFVTGEIKEGFPAEDIAKDNNFISLLYYFGLVTIGGLYQGDTKFIIPNEVVREQIFSYLLDAYSDNDLTYDDYDIRKKEQLMAYCGDFKPFFQFIADSIYTFASQRDRQKGESFVHGFTLAITSMCRFYRPISELDNQNGYADIFLRPRQEIYDDMEHSYIIELKYLNSKATDAQVASTIEQAKAQVCRYADTVNAKEQIGTTTLHKVYVVYRGVEMVACEEVVE